MKELYHCGVYIILNKFNRFVFIVDTEGSFCEKIISTLHMIIL